LLLDFEVIQRFIHHHSLRFIEKKEEDVINAEK